MIKYKFRLTWLLIPAGIMFLSLAAILISSWLKLNREQVKTTTETQNMMITDFSLNFAFLEQYVETHFADDCRGMLFSSAEADIRFENGVILEGQITLTYSRYIDESMEGGNIALTEFKIDPASEMLIEIVHSQGSGRSLSANDQAIIGSFVAMPLDVYFPHAAELANATSEEPFRLFARCSGSCITVRLFSGTDETLRYAERVTEWNDDLGFPGRVFEQLPDTAATKKTSSLISKTTCFVNNPNQCHA